MSDPGFERGVGPNAAAPAALINRLARCPYCRTVKPSDPSLPFWEYRGPGNGRSCDHCRYAPVAHTPEVRAKRHTTDQLKNCPGFTDADGFEFDSYYCGCRGWD